jgi:hypothetical protein
MRWSSNGHCQPLDFFEEIGGHLRGGRETVTEPEE